jgi:hypothetical protein
MTTLSIATQIPSNINTLEKLVAWAGLCLANTNPTLEAIEGQGYSERVAQSNIFYIRADNRSRLIIRASLPISNDYLAGGQKTWNYAQDLSNTAIPTIFTSN